MRSHRNQRLQEGYTAQQVMGGSGSESVVGGIEQSGPALPVISMGKLLRLELGSVSGHQMADPPVVLSLRKADGSGRETWSGVKTVK